MHHFLLTIFLFPPRQCFPVLFSQETVELNSGKNAGECHWSWTSEVPLECTSLSVRIRSRDLLRVSDWSPLQTTEGRHQKALICNVSTFWNAKWCPFTLHWMEEHTWSWRKLRCDVYATLSSMLAVYWFIHSFSQQFFKVSSLQGTVVWLAVFRLLGRAWPRPFPD